MSVRERNDQFLRSELAELDYLLSITPESATLDRMSLEHRRRQAEAELADNPPLSRWPASVRLAFNGKPIVDREGIYADFAGVAVDAFAKAVTSLAASQEGALGARGVIRGSERHRLLVTGTFPGSFGFELEEVQGEQEGDSPEASSVELAIAQAKDILESLDSNEETTAEALADTEKRAIDDLRDFLNIMSKYDAVCSLSFKSETFRFRDIGHVRQGLGRLEHDNLHEGDCQMFGYFQGLLPQGRLAEFVESKTGAVHSCRIDPAIRDTQAINEMLGQSVQVQMHYRQVGSSRIRYTVMDYTPAAA